MLSVCSWTVQWITRNCVFHQNLLQTVIRQGVLLASVRSGSGLWGLDGIRLHRNGALMRNKEIWDCVKNLGKPINIPGIFICFLMIWRLSLGECSIFRDLDEHLSLDDSGQWCCSTQNSSILGVLGSCLWNIGGCPQRLSEDMNITTIQTVQTGCSWGSQWT